MKGYIILVIMALMAFGAQAQTVAITAKTISVGYSTGEEILPTADYWISLKVRSDTIAPDTSITIYRTGSPGRAIVTGVSLDDVTLGVNDTTHAQKITAIQALGANFQTSAFYRTIIPKSNRWAWAYSTTGKQLTAFSINGHQLTRSFVVNIDSLKNESTTTNRLVFLRSTFYP
jgi:hypothetical protein